MALNNNNGMQLRNGNRHVGEVRQVARATPPAQIQNNNDQGREPWNTTIIITGSSAIVPQGRIGPLACLPDTTTWKQLFDDKISPFMAPTKYLDHNYEIRALKHRVDKPSADINAPMCELLNLYVRHPVGGKPYFASVQQRRPRNPGENPNQAQRRDELRNPGENPNQAQRRDELRNPGENPNQAQRRDELRNPGENPNQAQIAVTPPPPDRVLRSRHHRYHQQLGPYQNNAVGEANQAVHQPPEQNAVQELRQLQQQLRSDLPRQSNSVSIRHAPPRLTPAQPTPPAATAVTPGSVGGPATPSTILEALTGATSEDRQRAQLHQRHGFSGGTVTPVATPHLHPMPPLHQQQQQLLRSQNSVRPGSGQRVEQVAHRQDVPRPPLTSQPRQVSAPTSAFAMNTKNAKQRGFAPPPLLPIDRNRPQGFMEGFSMQATIPQYRHGMLEKVQLSLQQQVCLQPTRKPTSTVTSSDAENSVLPRTQNRSNVDPPQAVHDGRPTTNEPRPQPRNENIFMTRAYLTTGVNQVASIPIIRRGQEAMISRLFNTRSGPHYSTVEVQNEQLDPDEANYYDPYGYDEELDDSFRDYSPHQ